MKLTSHGAKAKALKLVKLLFKTPYVRLRTVLVAWLSVGLGETKHDKEEMLTYVLLFVSILCSVI